MPISLSLDRTSVLCADTSLDGSIIIGANTVVHPKASILAKKGTIKIGENNIIEEKVIIESNNEQGITIGNNNLIETASQLTSSIGSNNRFHPYTHIHSPCENTIVTAALTLESGTSQTNRYIWGSGTNEAGEWSDEKNQQWAEDQKQRIELLREIFTKSHKLIQ